MSSFKYFNLYIIQKPNLTLLIRYASACRHLLYFPEQILWWTQSGFIQVSWSFWKIPETSTIYWNGGIGEPNDFRHSRIFLSNAKNNFLVWSSPLMSLFYLHITRTVFWPRSELRGQPRKWLSSTTVQHWCRIRCSCVCPKVLHAYDIYLLSWFQYINIYCMAVPFDIQTLIPHLPIPSGLCTDTSRWPQQSVPQRQRVHIL